MNKNQLKKVSESSQFEFKNSFEIYIKTKLYSVRNKVALKNYLHAHYFICPLIFDQKYIYCIRSLKF